jgi:uncharacterized membrane protein
MTIGAKKMITLGLIYASIAKKYFFYTKHEVEGAEKEFINRLINRMDANETDCLVRMSDAANRELFIKEIRTGDTLQFENIIVHLLAMDTAKRNAVEQLVQNINNGELIEFTDHKNY